MRLYNGTELGLPLAANDHIMVGHRKLGFHPSLYTTRGATFGNSLMFATLIQDLQHVHHLHGCPVDSHQIAAMEALVRLKLPGGSRSLEVIAGRPRVALSNTVARAGFVGDGRPGPEDWELHCLAVLPVGSKMALTYRRHSEVGTRRGARLRRTEPTASILEDTVIVGFDGEKVTIETGPIKRAQ